MLKKDILKIIILYALFWIFLFNIDRIFSQEISSEEYLQLYANEYFTRNDSTIIHVEFIRTDYLGKEKRVDIFCKSYIIRNGVYRFLLPTNEWEHVPVGNTYGFRFKLVKYIPMKEDK